MPERSTPGSTGTVLKLVALAAIVGGAFLYARAHGLARYHDPVALAQAVRGLRERPHIVPLFVAGYALAAAVGMPGSLLTLAGGAIFGFALGTPLNWLGASLGAVLAFLLARALGLGAVRRLLGARARTLEALAGEHGFRTLLRLRLIPAVPYNVLNFAAALAGVSLRDYVLATVVGTLPIVAVYTWFADSLVSGAAGAERNALVHLFIAGGILVLVTFIPALLSRLRARGSCPG